jgi:hypothetical protein
MVVSPFAMPLTDGSRTYSDSAPKNAQQQNKL